MKKLLVEIINSVIAGLGMMQVESFPNRVIILVRILPDKGIPFGLPSTVARNKTLFLFGHQPGFFGNPVSPSKCQYHNLVV